MAAPAGEGDGGGVNIAVLTPSRSRPDRFAEMVQAIRDTADDDTIRVYLGSDLDDTGYEDFGDGVVHCYAPRTRLAAWTNYLAELALRDGASILAFFGDDHRPRTPGWDTRAAEAFDRIGGSGLVYCADGLQNERLPTAPFWSADVIRALGWFYPPVLTHLYADDYWLRLARDLDRCAYLGDVLIEHCHPSAGKAAEDESYRESAACEPADRRAFERFVVREHPAVLERVRRALA